MILATDGKCEADLYQLVSFALYNLRKHPECLIPLRQEITAMEANTDDPDNYDNMPLMDSFLKETARLNPTVICESNL